jgi:hypothetical protein
MNQKTGIIIWACFGDSHILLPPWLCLSAWTLWFVAGDPAVEAKVLEGKDLILFCV